MTAPEICRIRKALGETRETFGERFGCSARTVESWEQGLRCPHAMVVRGLEQLAKAQKRQVPER